MSASWQNKMFLIFVLSPNTKNSASILWHPSTDILKGTRAISPACASPTRHGDLGPGCGPRSGLWTSTGFSQPVGKVLKQLPTTEETSWNDRLTGEEFEHSTGANNMSLDILKRVGRPSLHCASPLPWPHSLGPRETYLAYDISRREKREQECPAPQAMGMLTKNLILSHPVQNTESRSLPRKSGRALAVMSPGSCMEVLNPYIIHLEYDTAC